MGYNERKLREMVKRIFPFLGWFKDYTKQDFRSDFIAGLTVALVLIPQSMAYAQLAGLPAYYGLYAAFLPPMVAALFGSSRQLGTGPVAVVSLMSAATLEPFATAGSVSFITYSIVLALMVGAFQFLLGILRLGMVVNFLSHPVVGGFTNAAAIIIATSQLSKLFGVTIDKADHHYETIYNVIKAALEYTHWPTLGLAVLAFAVMWGLKRLNPKIPNVLIAVVITTVISWATGFDHKKEVHSNDVKVPGVLETIENYNAKLEAIDKASQSRAELNKRFTDAKKADTYSAIKILSMKHELERINLRISELKEDSKLLRAQLRRTKFGAVEEPDGRLNFFLYQNLPPDKDKEGHVWHLKVDNKVLDKNALTFTGGGAVVGVIPQGLPTFALPNFDMTLLSQILIGAIVISMLGFMEAISIAKAMAAKTGQRLDPNQELIGQGLANIIGSLGQSYSVSGSFSRSAVNLQAGAVTGMSSVITSIVVVITLLLLTPLLYHLPQSVLAAVIMMAVIGLINIHGFIHAWKAQKYDGISAIITFIATLIFAPHLDKGIIIGVVFSLGYSLYKHMKPVLTTLALSETQVLESTGRHKLKECQHIAVIRFDGSLFFANSNYLEDHILDKMSNMPDLKHILIVGNGINELDASGEEMLSLLVDRLRENGLDISFCGLKEQIIDVLKRTRLYEKIGEDHIFQNEAKALLAIHSSAHYNSKEKECPLLQVCYL
jgi:SulP family sulfate permease